MIHGVLVLGTVIHGVVIHGTVIHRSLIHRALVHRAHAHKLGVDVRFGVDEELSRGHDAFPLPEPGEHFYACAIYPADVHSPASEAVLGELHDDPVRRFAGAADQRRRRNRQRQRIRRRADAHFTEHARTQVQIGVLEDHAHAQRPSRHI